MSDPADVVVIGGGIAGLAAAVELASAGRRVTLLEKRAFLGGRATSFVDRETGEEIDNCQHVVLGCCTQVLALFEKLGVRDRITFTDSFHYFEPGGRRHDFRPVSWLPSPLHYGPALLRFGALTLGERLAVARAFLAMMLSSRASLSATGGETMAAWLARHHQPEGAIRRFWKPILIGAVNERLDRASALPCLQVFLQGFLPHRHAATMGVPDVPLRELYAEPARRFIETHGGRVVERARVDALEIVDGRARAVRLASGDRIPVDDVVVAIPAEAAARIDIGIGEPLVAPEVVATLAASPITGVHLWFDREVLALPHAVLLDGTLEWLFPKTVSRAARETLGARQRIQGVVSASRDLAPLSQQAIVDLAVDELRRALPAARGARLVRGVVVKENHATFCATPAAERLRPPAATRVPNVFLAGDWTRTGWPSTLEGSTRSGLFAAAAVLERELPRAGLDLPRRGLAALLMARVPRDWPTAAPIA